MTDISMYVAGIPAIVRVTTYRKVRGNFSQQAMSPDEFYGDLDMEWEVCDRRGRAAPWLWAKVTPAMQWDIDIAVQDYMDNSQPDEESYRD
jgi:hypothetical protein